MSGPVPVNRKEAHALVNDFEAVVRQGEIILAEFKRGGKIRAVEQHHVEVLVLLYNRVCSLLRGGQWCGCAVVNGGEPISLPPQACKVCGKPIASPGNPATVMELVSEVERLTAQRDIDHEQWLREVEGAHKHIDALIAERDAARAEVRALREFIQSCIDGTQNGSDLAYMRIPAARALLDPAPPVAEERGQ